MNRKLKMLGVALAAVFAMNAVAAAGAQAVVATLEAKEHGTFTGEQVGNHIFTTSSGQELTCKKAHFTGNLATSNTELTSSFEYTECHTVDVFGITHGVTVTGNGCTYTFTNLTHNAAAADYNADVDIVCPAGKAIEVHIYNGSSHTSGTLCTLTIGAQGPKTGNTVTNSAAGVSPMDILIHHNVSVAVTRHGSGLCGSENQTSTYTGTTTLKAFNTLGKQVDLTAMTG